MNFKDGRKAVFLPACEKVLCQYKGYVLDEEMLKDLKEEDIYYNKKVFCQMLYAKYIYCASF